MDTRKAQHYSQNRSYQHSVGVEVLQQYMRWEEGDTVLDAGCGTGELCQYISQQPGVATVVGFDLSSDFVSYAREHNPISNVLYHVADASNASTIKPEWQGAFSKIVSIFVLHWIQDKVATLKVMHSSLKPGGEILCVCHAEESGFYRMSSDMASHPKWKIYLKDFRVPDLFPWPSRDSRLLEECGFQVITQHFKYHQYSFGSRYRHREALRSVLPHLKYIPRDRHEEFFADFEEMAENRNWLSDQASTVNDNFLVLHARKV